MEDKLLREALAAIGDDLDRAAIVAAAAGAVVYANRQARDLLGWHGPDGLAGRSLQSIPVARADRGRLQGDPGPWELESSLAVGSRTVRVRLTRRPIGPAPFPSGSVLLISNLERVPTAIAERDSARASDRAKTRSLHMVAHDMSGPITILNGYLSLVLEGSLRLPELEPHLPMLADQLDHMRRLVNVLLDTARLEEGRVELRLQRLDLGAFVENLVSRLPPPETLHSLVVGRPAVELPVMADPDRLDSIVRNLLSNAVKYSEEQTTVTCTLGTDGADATLEVADQGRGMESDELSRLFTRFGRVGDQSAHAGVGLGLFLSRELARLHGGELDVVSEPGRGSRFTLRLPLRTP